MEGRMTITKQDMDFTLTHLAETFPHTSSPPSWKPRAGGACVIRITVDFDL
jgi:hypothetical protein